MPRLFAIWEVTMNLYLDNGYLNFRVLRDMKQPFIIAVGGRGTGKTFGALQTSVEDKIKFAFMRRSQVQLDIINKPEFSPMKPVCRKMGWNITTASIARGLTGYYFFEVEDERPKLLGGPIGYNIALSTVANIRGFDASEIDLIIYDEAIPERGEKPLAKEYEKLMNCYETLNRNRELEGKPPMKLICLANANAQTAPILEGLRLVDVLDRMDRRGQSLYVDDSRGLAMVKLRDSKISQAKADTALYRLTKGTEFSQMAIENNFAYEDRGIIRSMPLQEFKPLVAVGGLTIYVHKSKRLLYVSRHQSGGCAVYGTSETELARFHRQYYSMLYDAIMENRVIYETYETQVLLTNYNS